MTDSDSDFNDELLSSAGDKWLQSLHEASKPVDLGKLGRFKIIREVSRGGQGIVYEAHQEELDRRVAIKRLLTGHFASDNDKERFQSEALAATLLNDPSIVTVHEIGIVDDQPIIVMEWIDGVPIHQYVRKNKLSLPETIKLFVQVCTTIQHAHTHGVIHRDIKPQNILVRENGEPCLIDFGLAAIESEKRSIAVTSPGVFLGTAAYAPPERFKHGHSTRDMRSDIYSLGVLLFELICDQPLYPNGTDIEDLIPMITNQRPQTPSHVRENLPNDMDSIVLKALEKDTSDRYQTAAALADDLQRWLDGLPILAHPQSTSYLVRKFVKRHKFAIASVSTGMLVLVTLTALAGYFAFQQHEQRKKADAALVIAEEERIKAEEALADAIYQKNLARRAELFIAHVLKYARSDSPGGRKATVEEAVDYASGRVFLIKELELQAHIHTLVANIYLDFEREKDIKKHLEAAKTIYADNPQFEHSLPLMLNLESALVNLYAKSDPPRAIIDFEELIERSNKLIGPEHELTLNTRLFYCGALFNAERYEDCLAEAEKVHEPSLRVFERLSVLTVGALGYQAKVHTVLGNLEKALEIREYLLENRRERFDADGFRNHPTVLSAAFNLADTYLRLGRLQEAEDLFRYVLEHRVAKMTLRNSRSINAKKYLGRTLVRSGKFVEAQEQLGQALEVSESMYGSAHKIPLSIMLDIGNLKYDQGDYESALDYYEACYNGRREILDSENLSIKTALSRKANALTSLGRRDESIPLLEELTEFYATRFGSTADLTMSSQATLAIAYAGNGDLDLAIPVYEDLLAKRTELHGAESPKTAIVKNQYGRSLQKADRYEEAVVHLEPAYAILLENEGPMSTNTLTCAVSMAKSLNGLDRSNDALALLQDLRQKFDEQGGVPTIRTADMLNEYAQSHINLGNIAQARTLLEERDATVSLLSESTQESVSDGFKEIELMLEDADYSE